MRNGVRTISPTCRDVTRLQSLAMDGQLTWAQQFGMRVHVLLCRWCRRYRHHLHLMRRLVSTHPETLSDTPSSRLSDTARDRMKLIMRGAQPKPERPDEPGDAAGK